MTRPSKGNLLKRAILVDVDGTLAGPYRNGKRELRPSAIPALRALSEHAPVILWSIVGPDNPRRLLQEFPDLAPFVAGCYGKDDFPLDQVEEAYAIDDEALDAPVLCCNHWILSETYDGGVDTGELDEAVRAIIDRIQERNTIL